MLKTPAGLLPVFALLACVAAVPGCAAFRSEPSEPLAEDIPQAPGLAPEFVRPGNETAEPPEMQAAISDLEARSQELERRIEEVKRQRRELERITEEIKALIKSIPRE